MTASRKPSSISNSTVRQRTRSSAYRMKRRRFSTDASSVAEKLASGNERERKISLRKDFTIISLLWRQKEVRLRLRSGTDDDLVYINFSRLLDGERNRPSNRCRWNRYLFHPLDNLGFDTRICHRVREVRVDESRRNARHAQLIASFLSQGLGDGPHGVLHACIDRHRRYDLKSGRRNDIDEMSETLPTEHRQRGGDAV